MKETPGTVRRRERKARRVSEKAELRLMDNARMFIKGAGVRLSSLPWNHETQILLPSLECMSPDERQLTSHL